MDHVGAETETKRRRTMAAKQKKNWEFDKCNNWLIRRKKKKTSVSV